MSLEFEVSAHVSRPVAEVYQAIADPATLSRYFTTGGARGRLEAGSTVQWDFHDFPGAFPVEVIEATVDERIVLRWESEHAEGAHTTVTIRFEPTADGRTQVLISERGWLDDDDALQASYRNCMGWSQMLCALKVWVEHGINLRETMYR